MEFFLSSTIKSYEIRSDVTYSTNVRRYLWLTRLLCVHRVRVVPNAGGRISRCTYKLFSFPNTNASMRLKSIKINGWFAGGRRHLPDVPWWWFWFGCFITFSNENKKKLKLLQFQLSLKWFSVRDYLKFSKNLRTFLIPKSQTLQLSQVQKVGIFQFPRQNQKVIWNKRFFENFSIKKTNSLKSFKFKKSESLNFYNFKMSGLKNQNRETSEIFYVKKERNFPSPKSLQNHSNFLSLKVHVARLHVKLAFRKFLVDTPSLGFFLLVH